MPPQLLFDISNIDMTQKVFGIEDIAKENPASLRNVHSWMESSGTMVENHCCVGYKDITDNEFWIRGHIPGRPIMPGVIMVEAAASALKFLHEENLRS